MVSGFGLEFAEVTRVDLNNDLFSSYLKIRKTFVQRKTPAL
jgi:hypothetical protein